MPRNRETDDNRPDLSALRLKYVGRFVFYPSGHVFYISAVELVRDAPPWASAEFRGFWKTNESSRRWNNLLTPVSSWDNPLRMSLTPSSEDGWYVT